MITWRAAAGSAVTGDTMRPWIPMNSAQLLVQCGQGKFMVRAGASKLASTVGRAATEVAGVHLPAASPHSCTAPQKDFSKTLAIPVVCLYIGSEHMFL